MAHRVLNEDWTDYDNKKKKFTDRFFVSCEEQWEKIYIAEKLKPHFPYKTLGAIRAAIDVCCLTEDAPRPREKFINCVLQLLES